MEKIRLQGARIHNLKNINLTIPKRQLVAVTGISGSGKSSLAFDILFEEGKNQYLRSIGILAGLDNEDRFDLLEGIGLPGNWVRSEEAICYIFWMNRPTDLACMIPIC